MSHWGRSGTLLEVADTPVHAHVHKRFNLHILCRTNTHDLRFMPQPVCRHRMHMLRVCCHSGRLTNHMWAVYVHTCVPMRVVSSHHIAL